MAHVRAYANRSDVLPFEMPPPKPPQDVPDFQPAAKSIMERRLLGLDVDFHLMAYERDLVGRKGVLSTEEARNLKPGQKGLVVGNPLRLRMPPTKTGKRVVFSDLEDETGILNLTLFDETYQRYGHALITQPYILASVTAQDRMGHKAFLVDYVLPYKPRLNGEPVTERLPLVTADFLHC
jgi:error-prone DNA polymerase